jgi:hypothetical protein
MARAKTARWTDSDTVKMIGLFSVGKTTPEIAASLGFAVPTVRNKIADLEKDFANIAASKQTTTTHHKSNRATVRYQNPELINEAFYSLLSQPQAESLTDNEVQFCWAYVGTNNYEEAMTASGLDAGLFELSARSSTGAPIKVKSYQHCLKLRIVYLKSKENILKFVKELRKSAVFTPDIDKDYLQQKIMIQLDNLDGDTSTDGKKLSRDYIQMLGRTFGGFTDKLEIGTVSHLESVKKLREHARKTETLEELKKKKQDLIIAQDASEKQTPDNQSPISSQTVN